MSISQKAGQGLVESEDHPSHVRRIRTVRNISIITIGLLFLQYLLSMTTNLFVQFSTQTAPVNPPYGAFTNGPYLLLFHIVDGLALGLLSIPALVLSVLSKSRGLILLALSGLGAIVPAGESGIDDFVLGWYPDGLYSFLMSFGFILSFVLDFLLLLYANRTTLGVAQIRTGKTP